MDRITIVESRLNSSELPDAPLEKMTALRRTVRNLQRAVAFYCDGLGFRLVADEIAAPGEAILQLGAELIVLVENITAMARLQPVAGPDLRFQHVAIVTSDMYAALARLQKQVPVAISSGGPQRLPAASGVGVCAFKFRDPDGHPLELIEFPPGQGAARWQNAERRDGPTLGIDHAAISVSNVDNSIAFYELLGLRLASRQLNRGKEQARLDGLENVEEPGDVEVEVVALAPMRADSPYLELLGYISPKTVREEIDTHGMADRLVWQAHELQGASRQMAHQTFGEFQDPDGHLNEITD